MKLLFITHHYLSGVGGGAFATKAFINAFAEIFPNSMTLLFPIKNIDDNISDLNKNIKKIPVTYNIPKWKKLYNLCIGKTHRFYEIFKEITKNEKYEYVVFDNSCVSLGLIDIAHNIHAKVITIHHNYEFEYIRDSSPNKFIRAIQLYWTKKYEGQSVIKSDLNLTLTKQDKELLKKNYHAKNAEIQVIGCFEYKNKNYIYKHYSQPNTFIITGNLSAKQTENSLIPWLHTYLPLLAKSIPDYKLTIAGKNPSNEIKELCFKLNIKLIDTPPSMDLILEESQFYICPTSLGGGIKLRIMDGLSHGLPVLTHQVSARGYDYFNDKYLFTYNDRYSFCKALEKLKELKYDYKDIIEEYKEIFSYQEGVKRLQIILHNRFNIQQ